MGETEKLIFDAIAAGASTVEYCARRQSYIIDLEKMVQINRATGVTRAVRRFEEEPVVLSANPEAPQVQCPPRPARLTQLVERLVSPAVQVQLPVTASGIARQFKLELSRGSGWKSVVSALISKATSSRL